MARMKKVLAENKIETKVKRTRKLNWFERFKWFISSENYIVVAGKDAQENEFLVKRYTTKYDIFVHSELHGSAVVIIKVPKDNVSRDPLLPVPPKTLCEAASFAICNSSAWESKVVVPAYWVTMSQVSKTAPTGEFLNVGGFTIRGVGILFKVDDSSVQNHLNDRIPKWNHKDSPEPITSNDVINSNAEEEISQETQPHDQLLDLETDSDSSSPENQESNTLFQAFKLDIIFDLSSQLTAISHSESTYNDVEITEPTVSITKKETVTQTTQTQTKPATAPSQFKRGQKYRYKKMKTKYKDQDEEERNLAEKLLHVSMKPKTSKKQKKLLKAEEKAKNQEIIKKIISARPPKEESKLELESPGSEDEQPQEKHFLSSFVSTPTVDDQLQYALLTCAPYSTLSTYKYKVKLTPGTTKRGKGFCFLHSAIKASLGMFMAAKDATTQEKLLISALKELDHARFIPQSVKVSAPSLLMNKHKKL